MLKNILKTENSQKLLKILLRDQLTCIISYPEYEILAYSEGLAPNENAIGKKPKDTNHYISKFSYQFSVDAHEFRVKGLTSKWLMIFKRETLASLELFQITDIPIFHNKSLVGVCFTFKNIVINDIHLINKLLNTQNDDQSTQIISDDESIVHNNTLSTLEKEILFFAALNKSNKQISSLQTKLGIRDIGHNTIKSTISQRIYNKLNALTIDDAIVKAIETKQIDKIPESILAAMLKDYYLIETEDDCIHL